MNLCLLLPQLGQAHDHNHGHHHGHDHHAKSLSAHVHGEANLSLAFDQKIIAVEYNGPAETLLGFEHQPKTEDEKKIFQNAKDRWEKNFNTLIVLQQKCEAIQSKFTINENNGHADIEAEMALRCVKDALPTSIEVKMIEHFSNIKKLKIDVLTTNGMPKTYTISEKSKSFKVE